MRVSVASAAASAAGIVALVITAATPVAASVAAGAPAVIHLGQIAHQDIPPQPGSEPDTLVEPDVAVSPLNSNIAIAAAHDGRFPTGGAVDISHSWTSNGGASWHHAPVQGLTKATGGAWDRASDPVVAFGPDGSAYLSVLVFDATSCATGVAVLRSTDGGATFGAPVLAHESNTCNYSDDKNWLVVDTQPKSPWEGRLYQFWTPFLFANGHFAGSPQVVRWSDDHGATWSATTVVTAPHQNTQNSQPLIHKNGTITDLYLGNGTTMWARNSSDGGATWSAGVLVTNRAGFGPNGVRCCLPGAALDPVTGEMYAVWVGPGTSDRVRLATSHDGVHWSAATTVSRDGTSTTIQHVNVAVTAYGGRVFVSYGTRDTAIDKGGLVQQQVSYSYDSGATFGGPISLGPLSDLKYAAVAGGKFPGDYVGAASTKKVVVLVWCVSSKPSDAGDKYHQTLYAAVLRP